MKKINLNLNKEMKVFVPFQGIHFFNTAYGIAKALNVKVVFVPFQGIHFFNKIIERIERDDYCFRPFSGNSFL